MKKTIILLALFLSVVCCLPLCAAALTLETTEQPTLIETVEPDNGADDAELTADVWFKPGLNALNDSTAAETFESWETVDTSRVKSYEGTSTVTSCLSLENVPDGFNGNNDGKALMLKPTVKTSDYYFKYAFSCSLKQNRMYSISFKFASNYTFNLHSKNIWIEKKDPFTDNSSGFFENLSSAVRTALTNKEWYNYNKEITWTANDRATFAIGMRYIASSAVPASVYLDDVLIMPYYKITYKCADGTDYTEQVLYGADGTTVLTEYSPLDDKLPSNRYFLDTDGKLKKYVGWSTDENAAEPMATVPLANADVTLYPVAKDVSFAVMNAKNYTALTVTAPEGTTWTAQSLGNSEATVDFASDGTSVTVKATGYAGIVTLSATLNETAYPVEIRLFSGEQWKPGLNTVTGTEQPFDFENMDEDELFAAVFTVTESKKWKLGVNPLTNGSNTSDKALYTLEAMGYLRPKSDYSPTIEQARGLSYRYDLLSNGSGYFMMNGQGGSNLYTSIGSSAGIWLKKADTILNTNKSPSGKTFTSVSFVGLGAQAGTWGDYESGKYFYLDNISYIPEYKITYKYANGTESTEYVLYDTDNTTLLTEYTPKLPANVYSVDTDGKLKKYVGWSTDENAAEPMATVPLNHKDVILYPVAKDVSFAVMNAYSGTALTVTAPEGTTWTAQSLGNSEAKVTADGTSVTVKATGYAGIVTLSATLNETAYPVEIRLFSGEKWKPGLNTVTGTEQPFDFEKMDEADVFGSVFTSSLGGWKIGNDPSDSGRGTSVYATKQYDYLRPMKDYANDFVIEQKRTLHFKFDTYSTNDIFMVINGYSGNDKLMNVASSAAWKSYAPEILLTNSYPTLINKYTTIKVIGLGATAATVGAYGSGNYFYLDNISYIPEYKITYVLSDGTESTVYALYDTQGEILHEYAVDAAILGADFYSLTADGEPIPVTVPVALENKDITVYARISEDKPFTIHKAGICAGEKSGIRFAAYISPQARDNASEYGILIARTDMLGDKELKFNPTDRPTAQPDVTFSGKTVDGVTYVGAANYIKTGDTTTVDKIYKYGTGGNAIFGTHAASEGDVFFAGVLTGLEKPYTALDNTKYATRYNVTFTARSYVKIGDSYFYGTTVVTSMKDVAQARKDSGTLTPGSSEEALVNTVLENAT